MLLSVRHTELDETDYMSKCTMCAVLFIYYIVLFCLLFLRPKHVHITAYGEYAHTCALSHIHMVCMHAYMSVCNWMRQSSAHRSWPLLLFKAIVALSLAISLKFQCISYSRDSMWCVHERVLLMLSPNVYRNVFIFTIWLFFQTGQINVGGPILLLDVWFSSLFCAHSFSACNL